MSLATLVLIWVRTSTLFMAARPVFGLPGVPGLVRLGLSVLVALMLWPHATVGVTSLPATGEGFEGPAWAVWAAAIGREVAVGLAMAFGVDALFGAVWLAGQLVDLPMGFSVVNVIDPTLQQETPLIGQFYLLLTTLVLFAVNGHHELIRALMESVRILPPGQPGFSAALVDGAVEAFARAFILGLRIAAPVMAAMFLADVALAVVARAVPQLNVFVVGFPVKLLLGFGALLLALPGVVSAVAATFGQGGMAWDLVRQLVQGLRAL